MEATELRPCDRQHLCRGVEFHRAGAQRDHRVHEREIPPLQAVEIAQHLVLRVIPVEDGVGKVLRGAGEGCREVEIHVDS